jgi:hypothetical protein
MNIRRVSAGRKSLSHPRKGRLKLEYASFPGLMTTRR